MPEVIVCTPKLLPRHKWESAAKIATQINPVNHPPIERLVRVVAGFSPTREHIAVLTTKYWGVAGVRLTVGFLDNPPTNLRARILSHMNAWARAANVTFVETKSDPQVRITRQGGTQGGYWSYLGTDILSIDRNQPTMNLEAFTMNTPESEFHRVVRHETGHTMGFPHEHMRRELVNKINPDKAIDYFGATQSWSPAEVRQQVLTPIEEYRFGEPRMRIQTRLCAIKSRARSPKTGSRLLAAWISTNKISRSRRLFIQSLPKRKELPKARPKGQGPKQPENPRPKAGPEAKRDT
jgi:Astacin (Peptidase family M12A)